MNDLNDCETGKAKKTGLQQFLLLLIPTVALVSEGSIGVQIEG